MGKFKKIADELINSDRNCLTCIEKDSNSWEYPCKYCFEFEEWIELQPKEIEHPNEPKWEVQ